MKLLNKTIRPFLVYSLTVLLITIPILYFVVQSVLLEAVDKSLRIQLREIRSNVDAINSEQELAAWSKLDKDIVLEPIDHPSKDSIYTAYRFTGEHHKTESEPYREISGSIKFAGKLYNLLICSSLVESDDLLGSILTVQVIFVLLLMGGLLWINRKISQKAWKPFYNALNNMQQYELNKNTNLPFQESDTDEFNELNQSVRHLHNRNYQIYIQQKEFTENASHEMQTPLAIFQSKLELLMQTSPLSESQATIIGDLENANQRLIRLNKSLLLLSKIENNQYPETESVDVNSSIKKIIAQYQLHAEARGIRIQTSFRTNLNIRANTTLVEILVSNLISNAIRHNNEEKQVFINIEEGQLIVKNTGTHSALSEEKMFHRFQKGTNSDNGDSIGLGLAIAKKICEMYSFKIEYKFSDDCHEFTVTF